MPPGPPPAKRTRSLWAVAPGVQLAPMPIFEHKPPMQVNPATVSQFAAWVAAVQVVAHVPIPPTGEHRKPFVHATGIPAMQVPAPLHWPAMLIELWMFSHVARTGAQEAALHCSHTPAAAPVHLPSVPQLVLDVIAHKP